MDVISVSGIDDVSSVPPEAVYDALMKGNNVRHAIMASLRQDAAHDHAPAHRPKRLISVERVSNLLASHFGWDVYEHDPSGGPVGRVISSAKRFKGSGPVPWRKAPN